MSAVPAARVGALAAHPVLEVMRSFESILHNGHHGSVQLREQQISRAEIDLSLVRLGPRLIEALGEVIAVEHDEVDNGLKGDADALAFLHLPRRPAVHPDCLVVQWLHWLPSCKTKSFPSLAQAAA